jgi:hypothetical protein
MIFEQDNNIILPSKKKQYYTIFPLKKKKLIQFPLNFLTISPRYNLIYNFFYKKIKHQHSLEQGAPGRRGTVATSR